MGRKDSNQYKLLSSQSLSTSFTSPVTVVQYTDNVSYQINVTTTDSTGTFAVQASNDYSVGPGGSVSNPGNWVTLTLGGGTPSVNVADDIISISMNQLPFIAIRLQYTSTVAGTGTCDAFISSKQLGG